jgi:hypothetical protein
MVPPTSVTDAIDLFAGDAGLSAEIAVLPTDADDAFIETVWSLWNPASDGPLTDLETAVKTATILA